MNQILSGIDLPLLDSEGSCIHSSGEMYNSPIAM